MLYEVHASSTGAHQGRDRTYDALQVRYYWPGMFRQTTDYVKTCSTCQRRKRRPGPAQGFLLPITIPPEPFHTVSMDVLKVNATKNGNMALLVLTCLFSKYPIAIPIPNVTADIVARAIFQELIVPYGVPVALISDQGSEFQGAMVKSLCRIMGIKTIRTSAWRPTSNGQCERMNKSLLDLLSAFCGEMHTSWDVHVGHALLAYRAATHAETGETPFFLVYGRECRLPIDLILEDERVQEWNNLDLSTRRLKTVEQYRADMLMRLRQAAELVRQRHSARQLIRAGKSNDKRIRVDYPVGTPVWLFSPQVPRRPGTLKQTTKLAHRWRGPFRVAEKVSAEHFILEGTERQRIKQMVHCSRLKVCFLREEAAPLFDPLVPEGEEFDPELEIAALMLPRTARGKKVPLLHKEKLTGQLLDKWRTVDELFAAEQDVVEAEVLSDEEDDLEEPVLDEELATTDGDVGRPHEEGEDGRSESGEGDAEGE
jgi:transposase InsO family protein